MAPSWLVRVLLVALTMNAVLAASRPMVSYTADRSGASAAEVGFIAACYGLLAVFVAAPSGRLIDRWGAPRFIVLGIGFVGLANVLLISARDLIGLAVSQLVVGLGFIACMIGLQTIIANNGSRATHDKYFGWLTVANSIGQIIGPLLVSVLAGRFGLGLSAFFATLAIIAAVGVGLALTLWRTDRGRTADAQRPPGMFKAIGEVLRIPSMPPAMATSLAIMASVDVIAVYLPLLGEANGIPVATVGLLLATSATATLLSRLLAGRLVGALGRQRLLVASMALPAVSLGTIPFVHVTPLLFVLMFVTGFGLGIGIPISLAWVASEAPAHMRGLALGTRMTANRTGQLTVPLVAGLVAGATGIAAVFLTLTTLLGSGAAVVWRKGAPD